MKKILFILHYPPPVHGAAVVGRYIKASAQINGAFRCRYINLSTSRTVDEIGGRRVVKAFRIVGLWAKVLIELLRFRPTLCYVTLTTQGVGFYKDAFLVLLVKLLGIPCVYHFHNKGVSRRQDKPFDKALYRWAFKNANVILLSRRLYSDIRKFVPESHVHYCPNGIPDVGFHLRPGPPAFSPQTACEILFLSNLIESKGVFVLLEACRILKEKGVRFHCTYVGGIGDVDEDGFREKIARDGLSDFVCYAGKKYGEEKARIFAQADIFAFPTFYHNETFGLVLLEAMQQGLPVVSTPEGGIPDVVDDGVTGFLVPQKDAKALSSKLEILINDPELRSKQGSAGRKKYEQEFTLEKFEQRMTEILRHLAR